MAPNKVKRVAQIHRQANKVGRSARWAVKRSIPLFVMVAIGLPGFTWAASWEVEPALLISETYTDNVFLTSDASKQEEWISEVAPGISIATDGANLRFDASYSPQFLYYANSKREETSHRLDVNANAELVRQLLFLDLDANVNQYNASVRAPQGTNNVNITGNRETIKTFSASPYLRRDFSSAVQLEARFTHAVVRSANPLTLSDSDSDRVNLRLNSGARFKLLTWDVNYAREDVDNDSQQDFLTEVTTANARRLISSTVSLLGQVGYEYYEEGAAPVMGDKSWSAGLGWAPTPRTNLVATAGERFFGDAYLLELTHRTRLATWSAGFTQSVASTRGSFLVPATASTASFLDSLFSSQFPDPVARQNVVDEFIAQTGLPASLSAPTNFFTNQLFIETRWQVSAGIRRARNVLIANVFRQTRERLDGNLIGPGDFDNRQTNGNVIQTGIGIVWDWNLTAQSALAINLTFGRNEVDGGQKDNTTIAGVGLNRRFKPQLSGSINYQRQSVDSNQTAFDYTENSVFATINKVF